MALVAAIRRSLLMARDDDDEVYDVTPKTTLRSGKSET